VFLILPGLITVPQEIASTALIASNQVRYNAYSRIIVAVISIVLSYFLSLKYGSTGAGIAIFIGNLIGGAIVLNIIYARILKIDVWAFFRKCQINMSLPFILVIFVGLALNHYITEVSWINLSAKILFLIGVYAFSAYSFALNSYEKNLLMDTVKKLK
jgi:O-antigen/teichoic acid export membrane protein